MDLTLTERYWIKLCMKLIAPMSHDNLLVSFITLVNWYNNSLLPLTRPQMCSNSFYLQILQTEPVHHFQLALCQLLCLKLNFEYTTIKFEVRGKFRKGTV
jgi:hypothetical protein